MLILSYQYKLRPTPEQAAVINEWLGICRSVYN
ncbi:helix-turn-helix domain-containing protein, partial [Spirulina subsalsa FACHB-351]|nr:helix-turn-helix domain-containing protein [Spirulina subsalsa FACHB-351]